MKTLTTEQVVGHVMVEPRPVLARQSPAIAYGATAWGARARATGVFMGATTGSDATGLSVDANGFAVAALTPDTDLRNVPRVPLPTG